MDDNSFCSSMMSMSMYMDGFQWSSLVSSKPKKCLNYLVAPWVLNDGGTFQGAMVYTFLLAIIMEGATYMTAKLKHASFFRNNSHSRIRKLLLTLIFGMHQWLGYDVMIITMTFSPELLFSAIAGLMVGHLLFPRQFTSEGIAVRYSRTTTTTPP